MDMANEKLITKEEAVLRIKPEDIDRLFYPVIDSNVDKKTLSSKIVAHGIDAVPGAAVGRVCFSANEAEEWAAKGEKVILVRRETSPRMWAVWPWRRASSRQPEAKLLTPR